MEKKKDRASPAERMQAHMDALTSGAQTGDSCATHLSPPIRFQEETLQLSALLEDIHTLTGDTLAATDNLLARCRETGLNNSAYVQAEDYWYRLADTICSLEQLLWLYCDEGWFSRKTLTRKLVSRKDLMGDSIEIQVQRDHAFIRMPHIPATKKRKFSIAEDLLWAKLLLQRDLPQWDTCHATFCHVYPTTVSQMPKDIDNYDYKRTIDILSYSFGFSDCPETFSMTMESMLSDHMPSGTYILLESKMPKKFQNFLKSTNSPNGQNTKNVLKSTDIASQKEHENF